MDKVLFPFKGEAVASKNTTLPNKAELFVKLRERALDPVVSLQGESAFDSTGVQALELIGESEIRSIGHAALHEVGLIVNRLDRSFRLIETTGKDGSVLPVFPQEWQEANLPVINENSMRSLAYRKERMYTEVLEPLSLGIATEVVQNGMDVAIFAHDHPSEQYILKPNSGSNNTDINAVSLNEAIALMQGEARDKEMIIQPRYDFTHKFAPYIKPFDRQSAEAFDGWNHRGIIKELRIYAFLSPHLLNMFPVARAFEGKKTHWVFIDPETVPEELYADTESVVRLSAELTGSRSVMATRDVGYGSLGAGGLEYKTVEINGRMPHLVGYHQHPVVADTLREYFADQIHDTVQNK